MDSKPSENEEVPAELRRDQQKGDDVPAELKRDQKGDVIQIDKSDWKVGEQIDPTMVFRDVLSKEFKQELKNVRVLTLNDDFEQQKEKITAAHVKSIKIILKNDIYRIGDSEKSKVDPNMEQGIKQMDAVNQMNWQYAAYNNFKSDKKIPMKDFESMLIGQAMDQIWNDRVKEPEQRTSPKIVDLVSIGLVCNCYSSVIKNAKGHQKIVAREQENDRYNRVRPPFTMKPLIDKTQRQEGFSNEIGELGRAWAKTYKGNEFAFPSWQEMINGLFSWFNEQINTDCQGKTKQQQKMILNTSRKTYMDLVSKVNISRTDIPMTPDEDPEIGLHNPYSKVSCFVLYIYSMEFGDPPLYAEANNAARDMRYELIPYLGPYIKVLGEISARAEAGRDDDDKIKTGKYLEQQEGGVANNIGEIFLLWRGAQMKEEWLLPYYLSEGKNKVNLPGNTSSSRDLKVAFQYAFKVPRPGFTSVLFVLSCRNYNSPFGIRLNNPAFSAFPEEDEFLLSEGCGVYVLKIQKNVKIKNDYGIYEHELKINGKKMMIIHMYHHGI